MQCVHFSSHSCASPPMHPTDAAQLPRVSMQVEPRQALQAMVHTSSSAVVLLQVMHVMHFCSHAACFCVWQDWLCQPGLILGQDNAGRCSGTFIAVSDGSVEPSGAASCGRPPSCGSKSRLLGKPESKALATLNCSLVTVLLSTQASKLLMSNLLLLGNPFSRPLISTTRGASAETLTSRKPPLKKRRNPYTKILVLAPCNIYLIMFLA